MRCAGCSRGRPASRSSPRILTASSAPGAEEVARESREKGFLDAQRATIDGWRRRLDVPRAFSQVSGDRGDLAHASTAVLLSLEDKATPGAFVAAPAAPWGESCTD